ncbi:hypothetical protein [Paenibacillus sp. Soil787]|uniref:hypothetical protein n=1 Tax=Paenibacillus sp. Soil787 TaxID=1736411 RepID=UPI0006FC4549|nr:hypothetical protein [Paenibacillus sp. Soil787]KRF41931.1 hypothetical protein ASG93_22520 [Paenibacillus sp. Soil787]
MKEKRREDAWEKSHDLTLVQTVISHIKNGSTQLAAFEESASQLNRTAAACGFRWNKELRSQYETEINDAKSFRMNLKQQKQQVRVTSVSSLAYGSIGPKYEEAFNQIIKIARDQAQKFEQLINENSKLKLEINELKNQRNYNDSAPAKTNEDVATEDLQTFIKIMNRARNLTFSKKV